MVIEKIKQIIAEHLDVPVAEITAETTFDELGIDSSELVDLVISVENEYNIEIPNRVLAKFRSVGDIVKTVEKS